MNCEGAVFALTMHRSAGLCAAVLLLVGRARGCADSRYWGNYWTLTLPSTGTATTVHISCSNLRTSGLYDEEDIQYICCLLYTSPSPRDS